LVGAPARQPDLVRASRKSGGGAAEGSTRGHRVHVQLHEVRQKSQKFLHKYNKMALSQLKRL